MGQTSVSLHQQTQGNLSFPPICQALTTTSRRRPRPVHQPEEQRLEPSLAQAQRQRHKGRDGRSLGTVVVGTAEARVMDEVL